MRSVPDSPHKHMLALRTRLCVSAQRSCDLQSGLFRSTQAVRSDKPRRQYDGVVIRRVLVLGREYGVVAMRALENELREHLL